MKKGVTAILCSLLFLLLPQISFAAPAISAISPTRDAPGNLNVTVTGSGFTGANTVWVCDAETGARLERAAFTVNSDNQISASVSLAEGSYFLRVRNPEEYSNRSQTLKVASLRPKISAVSPSTQAAGTFAVTILGNSFTGVSLVKVFDAQTGLKVASPEFTVNSDTQITATVSLQAGTYFFRVRTQDTYSNRSKNIEVTGAPAPVSYRLRTLNPDIINVGTVSEGVSTSGTRIMMKGPNGQIHILAAFGGDKDNGWFAHYVNLNTGESTLIKGADKGTISGSVYHPVYHKLYSGTNYAYNAGSLTEFDPVTRTLTKIADKTLSSVSGGLCLGDDNRIYHVGLGGHMHSYDPGVGLPNGWKDYGVPNVGGDPGSQYFEIAVDTSHVYLGLKRTDGTWTLAITPISGAPNWREWEFGHSGDTGFSVALNENHTEHVWTLTRTLANGSKKFYRLQNGSYTELIPGQAGYYWSGTAPNQFLQSEYHWWEYGPPYCISESGQSPNNYIKAYGWEPDFTDMFPIRGIHEYSTIKYRQAGATAWNESTVSFPGPWVPQKIQSVALKSDLTTLAVSGGYNAAIELDPASFIPNYLGANSFSPYQSLNHPSGEIYVGGYPDKVFRYDPTKPWSLTSANATPRLPSDVTKPNPYFIQMTSSAAYHYRHGLDYDYQGTVWIGGNTTRDNPNHGNVMWYNPQDGSVGYMFPGWKAAGVNFRNLCTANNRSRVCISDNAGRIWIIDAATKTVDPVPIEPMPGVETKTYMIEVADDVVFGIVFAPGPVYKVIRFSPSTKQILTLQDLGVSGIPFGFGDNQYDRMNYKLELGPDGYVWMFVGNSLYQVDPATCVFNKIKDTNYAQIKFSPDNTDLMLYCSGSTTDFKYIPGLLEPVYP